MRVGNILNVVINTSDVISTYFRLEYGRCL